MDPYEKYIASDPKVCFVCKTPFSPTVPSITKEFTGELYAFCSQECITAFEEDPEQFEETEDEEENGTT